MGSGFPPRKDSTPPTSAYPHPMSFLARFVVFMRPRYPNTVRYSPVIDLIAVIIRSNEGCGGEGGGGGGGCDLEWCEYTPALTEFQVDIVTCMFFELLHLYDNHCCPIYTQLFNATLIILRPCFDHDQ